MSEPLPESCLTKSRPKGTEMEESRLLLVVLVLLLVGTTTVPFVRSSRDFSEMPSRKVSDLESPVPWDAFKVGRA